MKIQIDKIVDHGQNSERVEILVIQNCNLNNYILADTTYTDYTHISNKLRHMHWFLNREVKAGDKIVLYTKKGTNTSTAIGNGNTRYVTYWQLDVNVWNNDGDAALLFEISDWKTTKSK